MMVFKFESKYPTQQDLINPTAAHRRTGGREDNMKTTLQSIIGLLNNMVESSEETMFESIEAYEKACEESGACSVEAEMRHAEKSYYSGYHAALESLSNIIYNLYPEVTE